ncbi:hypothetical protein LXM60_13890 [Pandoraea sputorum]|uniref:hypothetical protein n=1 Tax=Pandoraea sputorum TaxID=93222 RepID=UPI001E2F39D6|nr:hypothetical protein [Pandoraea sputorum]MCE4061296.1 hypothetical protein [Pandoraea sputorum]
MSIQYNQGRYRHIKGYLAALMVLVWACTLIYALNRNPSASDSKRKLETMSQDIDTMLQSGAVVVGRDANSKFGGALLIVRIEKGSWTETVEAKSISTLLGLGWEPIDKTWKSLCKQEIRVDIEKNPGGDADLPLVVVAMSYDAATIETCRQRNDVP